MFRGIPPSRGRNRPVRVTAGRTDKRVAVIDVRVARTRDGGWRLTRGGARDPPLLDRDPSCSLVIRAGSALPPAPATV